MVIGGIFFSVLLLSQTGGSPPEKIGFLLATMKEERYEKDKRFFIDKAREMGFEVLFDEAKGDQTIQMEKAKAMLEENVKILVVQPVSSEISFPIVEMAHKKGIPVIAYDRIIKDADLDFYITHDNFNAGVLQAKAAVKATGGKGNYIILMGEEGHSVAHQITAGNLFILNSYPEVRILLKKAHKNWSAEEAKETMREAIKRWGMAIDAVLANNSSMIAGAIEVLMKYGLEKKVFTAGADADLINCRFILKGLQSMDVLKDIKPLAEKAAEVAAAILKGEKVKADKKIFNGKKEVDTIFVPVQEVNRENLEEVVIKSGFHSRKALYELK